MTAALAVGMLNRTLTAAALFALFCAFAPRANAQEGEAPQPSQHDVRTGLTFEGGLVGVQTLNLPTHQAPMVGIHLALGYNARRFGILADVATARARDESQDHYDTANVGGRWYILDGAFSPYLGAGFGLSSLWIARPGSTVTVGGAGDRGPFQGSGDGADLYAEIGLLAFRTQSAPRLSAALRADLPLYKVSSFDPLASNGVRYTPMSLMVSIVF